MCEPEKTDLKNLYILYTINKFSTDLPKKDTSSRYAWYGHDVIK
jgi:hypothetical protein